MRLCEHCCSTAAAAAAAKPSTAAAAAVDEVDLGQHIDVRHFKMDPGRWGRREEWGEGAKGVAGVNVNKDRSNANVQIAILVAHALLKIGAKMVLT